MAEVLAAQSSFLSLSLFFKKSVNYLGVGAPAGI